MNTLPHKIQRRIAWATQIPAEFRYHLRRFRQARNLPALSARDRQIVESIEQTGVCVTSLDRLNFSETAAMLTAAAKQLALMRDLLPAGQVGDRIAQTKAVHPQIFTVSDLAEFANWGNSARMLAIAENYIGLPVCFQGVHLRRDFANRIPITTELWHQDLEDRRILKAIVYLSDVKADSGAFEYIPKSTVFPILAWRIRQRIDRAPAMGIDDATMATIVPRSQWKFCLGAAGTVVFVDSKNTFHHGRSRRCERAAAFFVYTADRPLRPQHCTQYRDATFTRPILQATS